MAGQSRELGNPQSGHPECEPKFQPGTSGTSALKSWRTAHKRSWTGCTVHRHNISARTNGYHEWRSSWFS